MNLVLQRQLRGDCAKWRTVGRFPLEALDDVLRDSDALARLLEPLAMRIVTGDITQRRLASWAENVGWTEADAVR